MTDTWFEFRSRTWRLKGELATQLRPLRYLKAHASAIVRDLAINGPSMVITQNGDAKAVIQGIHSDERTQKTLALLTILALGPQQIVLGKVVPLDDAVSRVESGHCLAK